MHSFLSYNSLSFIYLLGDISSVNVLGVSGVSTNVSGVSTNVSGVSSNVSGVSSNVSGVSSNISDVSSNISGVEIINIIIYNNFFN